MEQKNIIEIESVDVIDQDLNCNINWIELVMNIDLVSLRILEKFYRNGNPENSECYVFGFLYKELKGLKVSKDTVLRRCYKLQEMGLLETIKKTRPLIIWPVKGIEKNVRKMITQAYSRILGEEK